MDIHVHHTGNSRCRAQVLQYPGRDDATLSTPANDDIFLHNQLSGSANEKRMLQFSVGILQRDCGILPRQEHEESRQAVPVLCEVEGSICS